MSTINMLRTKDGTRCAWDREVGAEIAAWLRMMYVRAERHLNHYANGGESPGICQHDGEPNALVVRMKVLGQLIRQIDNSWSLTDWEAACQWVDNLLESRNDNPEATAETGNAQCDGIGPEQGPGCTTGADSPDAPGEV